MDRKDRGDFLRFFYRRYEDAPVSQIDEDSQELLTNLILTKSFPRGMRRVREHRALGHRTILITGALDFAVEGLRPLFDEIIAAEMTVKPDGTYSGHLVAGAADRRDPRPDPGRLLRSEGLKLEAVDRLRRLDQRPADARGRRLPRRRQPRDQAGGDRPQARLAGRALVEGGRRPAAAAADRTAAERARARTEVRMSRLVFERKPVKFAAGTTRRHAWRPGAVRRSARCDSNRTSRCRCRTRLGATARHGWRASAASDLAMIDGTASAYFDPLVSYPFTPGHEVVADDRATDDASRLVPVLSCVTRGIDPMCAQCAAGRINLCERVAFGHLEAGLQSGFCTDTGGGWSTGMVAHTSQLVDVPDDLSDEAAVMIEPTACAAHAALRYHGHETVIIGAGTVGLLTLAAITATRDKRSQRPDRSSRPATPSRRGWPRSSAPTSSARPTSCRAGSARRRSRW